MPNAGRRRWYGAAAVATLVSIAALTMLPPQPAYAESSGTIDAGNVLQPIDGFGFSEFFGRSAIMNGSQGLSAPHQQEILDLLLSPTSGAGLSILRLGIASTSSSIQPTDPGGPDAPPKYVWNGDDEGQVWLAKQAKAYGVTRFYADAWSAPGYMKDNGDQANGGTLCGLSGTSCASGDWRRAYAEYLVQFAKFYAQESITITDLGFTNEPNFTATYGSMRFTPEQAVEFAKILGPIADAAGLKVACCDVVGWSGQKTYTSAIVADPEANRWVNLHTGHSYGSYPTTPLPVSNRHTWMSEWSPNGATWNENWDDGSKYDGFRIAQEIQTALTGGNVNGYVYWYGASLGATRGLIQIDGDGYHVSKRLWAMANYSRFIRPGANRVGAVSSDPLVSMSAYRNPDGTIAVVALNSGASPSPQVFNLENFGFRVGTATPYLTDAVNNTAAQPAIPFEIAMFRATVPARSLVTYVIRRDGSNG
jgi:glucuronoarabinoxylan endo-1,4-beta-xylanase